MTFDPRNPDAAIVATFRQEGRKNELKSKEAGRPIYDDVEICEIRLPGSRDMKAFPAHAFSHWDGDPLTGGQVEVTYAERFRHQYRQFKEKATQTKTGTPLELVPFLTEARRAELRALNVYTAEQLAGIDGQELKNLGPGGRDLKNRAEAYIAEAKTLVADIAKDTEIEALRARLAVVEQDNEALKHRRSMLESEFDSMTTDEICAYIKTHTGVAPVGQVPHKNLIRMAIEATPHKAA
jgi:hypothetical protein